MSPTAAFLLGLVVGAPGGIMLAAIMVAGRNADERTEAYTAGYMRGIAHGTIKATVRAIVGRPRDDGARLLREIADEAERSAAWSEMDAHRSEPHG